MTLWLSLQSGISVAANQPVWYRTSMPNDVLSEKRSGSRRFAPLGIIFGLLGLLLFAYFVSRAGVGEIFREFSDSAPASSSFSLFRVFVTSFAHSPGRAASKRHIDCLFAMLSPRDSWATRSATSFLS